MNYKNLKSEMNNKTKQQIRTERGEKITSPVRIRRSPAFEDCQGASEHRYSVTVSNGMVTVRRIHTITPQGLTEKLRAMKPGEVCHPCEGRRIREVSANRSHVGRWVPGEDGRGSGEIVEVNSFATTMHT